jgi:NAD(P)-dependent dehydrogenase (short-subunit alcohol dehydrogenase family)
MNLSSFANYPSLKDKSVFITGGGSGIGAAITESFAHQGSKVTFVDIDEKASNALVKQVAKEHGHRPRFRACDIRKVPDLKRAIAETVAAQGPIDVLVNNAARDDRHAWDVVDEAYWDEFMAVTLRHMFFATQAIAPEMAGRGGGAIINFGSVSWKMKTGGFPIYTAGKAAVHGLTTSAARDYGKQNVRVNTVVPGWVMTERQLKLWVTPEGEATIDRQQCLAGRLMPIDIARMVLFLASDDARMCSGQEFIVDAGWV